MSVWRECVGSSNYSDIYQRNDGTNVASICQFSFSTSHLEH